jgi:hypothetical protein
MLPPHQSPGKCFVNCKNKKQNEIKTANFELTYSSYSSAVAVILFLHAFIYANSPAYITIKRKKKKEKWDV